MSRQKSQIIYIGVFIIFIFLFCGVTVGKKLLCTIGQYILLFLKSLNLICVEFNGGDGILNLFFCHPITYFLVGIIFWFIPMRKDIGSIVGKICYALFGFVVGAILNSLSTVFFSF